MIDHRDCPDEHWHCDARTRIRAEFGGRRFAVNSAELDFTRRKQAHPLGGTHRQVVDASTSPLHVVGDPLPIHGKRKRRTGAGQVHRRHRALLAIPSAAGDD